MPKTNLQVRIPSEIDSQIGKIAPKSKSDFVRRAIEEKIHRDQDRQLEDAWIRALSKNPEDIQEASDWIKAEEWGSR